MAGKKRKQGGKHRPDEEGSTVNTEREVFGSMVFGDEVMRERLPRETYLALRRTIREGRSLGRENQALADVVASAMKDWAVEKGATHYTHWFQPMTGITAEKHESFLAPTGEGAAILEFSGKELIRGEPDASSFPSGGLRATFEARGYTAWDPTSYAFIKDDTLCIPTAFCSYGGEALDKKTPLLRSMEALSRQAVRVLRLFGDQTTQRVSTSVGVEQEYFLVDERLYDRRPDLKYTGRTLFGAKAPKGQELDDHYFGALKARVKGFMEELNTELWKLGVYAKTEHNEVAPSQHELAPIYTTANIAADHNQLTMETMKKVARRHGFVCLLHEKPYAGVNGSGKHNNWSLRTDGGQNLLDPGDTPRENAQFLLFLCAVIKGVDDYQDLLRASVATAGNDHRLGASEAPPSILSIFLGDELTAVLQAIERGERYDGGGRGELKVGVHVLPRIPLDNTDRNRTSPFAFTGNKFEFRMPGSALSISGPNTILNAIVTESLAQFADELEGAEDFDQALAELLARTVKEHRRILFSGNGYSDDWVEEAQRRGLANLPSAADAIPCFLREKNISLLAKHKIYSEVELRSRVDILLENYAKVLSIEAQTMLEMARRDILPAVSRYTGQLCAAVSAKRAVSPALSCRCEEKIIDRLAALSGCFAEAVDTLEEALLETKNCADLEACARHCREKVFPAMQKLRAVTDEMETLTAADCWPYPSYGQLLFSE
ncbi:glutamine synthetase III [Acetanaerobacterium sp. MSJ-12]|nr:glutamine synthetase III [Acetanaerobacterium sp. MSJ-12]